MPEWFLLCYTSMAAAIATVIQLEKEKQFIPSFDNAKKAAYNNHEKPLFSLLLLLLAP